MAVLPLAPTGTAALGGKQEADAEDLPLQGAPASPVQTAREGDLHQTLAPGDDRHRMHATTGGQRVQAEAPRSCQTPGVSLLTTAHALC